MSLELALLHSSVTLNIKTLNDGDEQSDVLSPRVLKHSEHARMLLVVCASSKKNVTSSLILSTSALPGQEGSLSASADSIEILKGCAVKISSSWAKLGATYLTGKSLSAEGPVKNSWYGSPRTDRLHNGTSAPFALIYIQKSGFVCIDCGTSL